LVERGDGRGRYWTSAAATTAVIAARKPVIMSDETVTNIGRLDF
jgi:hypothetical protein